MPGKVRVAEVVIDADGGHGRRIPVLTSATADSDNVVQMLSVAQMRTAMLAAKVLPEEEASMTVVDLVAAPEAAAPSSTTVFEPFAVVRLGTHTPYCRVMSGDWAERAVAPLRSNIAARNIRHIFAYGTLRVDDQSGASWTKTFNAGMTSRKGRVHGLKLFFARYPFVTPAGSSSPVEYENHANFVVGQAVSTDNEALWARRLAEADSIEGYPWLYQKAVVEVELDEKENKCEGGGERVLALVYYRMFCEVVTKSAMFVAQGTVCSGEEDDVSPQVSPILSGDFCKQ